MCLIYSQDKISYVWVPANPNRALAWHAAPAFPTQRELGTETDTINGPQSARKVSVVRVRYHNIFRGGGAANTAPLGVAT